MIISGSLVFLELNIPGQDFKDVPVCVHKSCLLLSQVAFKMDNEVKNYSTQHNARLRPP